MNNAQIIHLDEYIKEYIEKNSYNLVNAIADVLSVSPEDAKTLYNKLDFNKEFQLVNIFTDQKTNDLEKRALVRGLFSNYMNAIETKNAFNGIDVIEGYNYRASVSNQIAKNRLMDWLEESGIDYLIDANGNFAVKCPDRKQNYHVTRKFEQEINRWDRGPVKKSVDPDMIKQGFPKVVNKTNMLNDSDIVENIPQKSKYEDNEAGAINVLNDKIGHIDVSGVRADPVTDNVWLIICDTMKKAYLVNTEIGDCEEANYDDALSNMNENVAGKKVFARQPSSELDPRTSWFGHRYAAGEYYDEPSIDPNTGMKVPLASRERQVNIYSKISSEELFSVADKGFAEKAKLLRKYFPNIPNERIIDAVKALTKEIKLRKSESGMSEAKGSMVKKAKEIERAAKEKLSTNVPGSGIAAKLAHTHSMAHGKTAGAMNTDKKGYQRHSKHKNKEMESISEAMVLGMTGIEMLATDRLRQLAGILPNTEKTEIVVEPVTKSNNQISDFRKAMEHIKEVLNIYCTLNTEERSKIRRNLIDVIMENEILNDNFSLMLKNTKKQYLKETFENLNVSEIKVNLKKYINLMQNDLDLFLTESKSYIGICRVINLLQDIEEGLV